MGDRAGTGGGDRDGGGLSGRAIPFESGKIPASSCARGRSPGARGACTGSLPANPWGLHEVHGNVWEWVQDCRHDSYTNAPTDGRAWGAENGGECGERMLRGGSWGYGPSYLHSAFRLYIARNFRDINFGFRLARTLP